MATFLHVIRLIRSITTFFCCLHAPAQRPCRRRPGRRRGRTWWGWSRRSLASRSTSPLTDVNRIARLSHYSIISRAAQPGREGRAVHAGRIRLHIDVNDDATRRWEPVCVGRGRPVDRCATPAWLVNQAMTNCTCAPIQNLTDLRERAHALGRMKMVLTDMRVLAC
jgi:hypothetical protein